MSLKDCIRAAQQRGDITLEEAQQLYERYDRIARHVLSPPAARARLIAELDAEALERKRRALLTETLRQDREADVLGHLDKYGNANPAEGVKFLVSHEGQAKFDDVNHKGKAILAQAQSEMEELLHEFRKGAVTGDLRRRYGETAARLDNVVRELFGEATGDAKAKGLADSWTRVSDALRQRFNAAGGAIGKLEKWGLPQIHDQQALLRAGRDAWIAHIEPRLAADRMRHPLTDQPMTAAELREALEHVYDTIVSDGWNTREPTGSLGRGAIFSRHADHRFLVFKNADAWLEYQRAFGQPDPFAAMMGHLHTMAKDIAAMELLGPNPEAMLKYLQGVALKASDNKVAANIHLFRANEMWEYLRGTTNTPVNPRFANTMSNVRNVISSSALGAASITSLSDLGSHAIRLRFNGMPSARIYGQLVKMAFSADSRRLAVRSGLILDAATNIVDQQARYVGSLSGNAWSKFLADRNLTFSGLSPFTQIDKWVFGMELQGNLADQAGRSLADLPPAMRQMLERHGFDASTWDAIRQAPLYEPRPGATLLRPKEIAAAAGTQLADRYVAMILRETTYAIPESTLASYSLGAGSTRPGTLIGELVRTGLQFKSFPIAFAMLHGGQVFREIAGGRAARGAVYAGGLLVVMSLWGALSLQLKEIAKGRDPRDMTPLNKQGAKFWGAAMLQGGGAGIYGDFLFADVNRFGGGMARTVTGPLWDRANGINNLILGNVLQKATGERTNAGRELVNTLRQDTPFGSLFYLRLAWERVVLDQMQSQIDPDAHNAFRRRMNSQRRDYGNEYFWAPGQVAPSRAPGLERAAGQR